MEKTLKMVDNIPVVSGFRLEKGGLVPVGEPTFEQWATCGAFLKNASGAVHFWIGDWLNFGEDKWGEMYAQAVEDTGYAIQTLMNDKWVAGRVKSLDRRENLPYSHHVEVANLEPEEQKELLDRAEREHLDVRSFRQVVRAYNQKCELPELKGEQSINKVDFALVDQVVDLGMSMLEKLRILNVEVLDKDAKALLLSQLRKVVAVLGTLLLKYEDSAQEGLLERGVHSQMAEGTPGQDEKGKT